MQRETSSSVILPEVNLQAMVDARIRLFAVIQLVMIGLLLIVTWTAIDNTQTATISTISMAVVSLIPIALLLLRDPRWRVRVAFWDLVLTVLVVAAVDPLDGTLSGSSWPLLLVWPPVALLVLRSMRRFVLLSVLEVGLLVCIPLLEFNGVLAVELLSPRENLILNWLVLLITNIILLLIIAIVGRDEQRALRRTSATLQTLAETNTTLKRTYTEAQSANQQLEQALQDQALLNEQVQKLGSPMINLGAGLVLLPLVGQLDAARLEHLGGIVPDQIHALRAELLVLDMTGAVVANQHSMLELEALIETVLLLGCEVAVTGLSAELAEMVALNPRSALLKRTQRLTDIVRQRLSIHSSAVVPMA